MSTSTPNQSLFLVTLLVSDQSLAKSFYCTQLGFDCVEDSSPSSPKRREYPSQPPFLLLLHKPTCEVSFWKSRN